MNIFTNDDYRRIQAWLKANAIKDSDFEISEETIPDEDILVITQNMSVVPTNYKIKIKDLLNSSLGKVIIDKIMANAVTITKGSNDTHYLEVDASQVILDENILDESRNLRTLQDVFEYFKEEKLNRHTDDTFDGNLHILRSLTVDGDNTVKGSSDVTGNNTVGGNNVVGGNITVNGNAEVKSGTFKLKDTTITNNGNNTTIVGNVHVTEEFTDGNGNKLSDVNAAAKGWILEYQDPSASEPTVREKFVLKNYKGEQKGNTIKIYKDSAITNVYLGTTEDTCNSDTGVPTKHPIHDNNEALCIVYHLENGKYNLVPIPLGAFVREAEFDKYRGLGITPNGQVFVKLADDEDTTNYLGFNDDGEITAAGLEERILRELGSLVSSVAGDGTMWGLYKQHEGTREGSTPNDGSRWGEYRQAEIDRSDTMTRMMYMIEALFAGAKVTPTISPTTIYKNTATTVSMTATVSGVAANQIKLFEDSVSGTLIKETAMEAEPTLSTLTASKSFNLSGNSKTIVAQANYRSGLFTGVVTLSARYPIYKGFGSVYTDVVKDANKLSARTSAAGRNYSATASANNQKYFILIPNDISVPGTATMGGAPYVFNQSTQTISGVQYTVLTSGATYNTGATVDITLA